MEEIEVGEYVRTFNGLIGKVVQLTDSGNYTIRIYNGAEYVVRAVIAKHSKNIIDLIEVGDYVNGKRIHKIDKGENYCYLYYGNCKTFVNYQIKTILTKEMYESNCYTVERKEEKWDKD